MSASSGTAVTIGFFDGVHLGHQELLRRVRAAAGRLGAQPGAVTFDLHSLEVLHGRGPMRTMLTTDEKVETLRDYGMELVHVLHFTPRFAAQSGPEFVDRTLVRELAARYVAVGVDFRFGHGRSCGAEDLVELAGRHGIAVEVVPKVDLDGQRVSSSACRALIAAGDVSGVARLLGRPFRVQGEVVEGCHVGRQLGFPTANLRADPRKLLPGNGVYAVRAHVGPERRDAVANVGVRPTVGGGEVTVEVHLFDVNRTLYGLTVGAEFVARLREEQRFSDLDALRAQITVDCAAARAALSVPVPQDAADHDRA